MISEAEMVRRARELRKNPTPFETIMWRHLSRSQLEGHKFRRQHVIETYIVDFFCPAKGLIVEIDGDTHELEADKRRDADLNSKGFEVLRFSNREVAKNLEGVLERLVMILRARPSRWGNDVPHPNPSPEGEGL